MRFVMCPPPLSSCETGRGKGAPRSDRAVKRRRRVHTQTRKARSTSRARVVEAESAQRGDPRHPWEGALFPTYEHMIAAERCESVGGWLMSTFLVSDVQNRTWENP